MATSDRVALAGPLGVDEQAVRSSVSRLSRKGLFLREVRGGQVGYALSEQAWGILAEGDLRIYDKLRPARLEDGWVLAAFSVPERLRSQRHQLRTRLTWLGFGNLGPGLWIAPRRVLERTIDTIREVGLDGYVDVFEAEYRAFDDPVRLVGRCWDLAELEQVYAGYVDRFEPVVERWQGVDAFDDLHEAYVDYVSALHDWRKTPYLDPGLPTDLLPDAWAGTRAGELFAAIRRMLEEPARRFFHQLVSERVR